MCLRPCRPASLPDLITRLLSVISPKIQYRQVIHRTELCSGAFVHLINKRWLNKLPEDLRRTFLEVIAEESADTRVATRKQHADQVAKAKEAGVTFYQLSEQELAELKKKSEPVLEKWGQKIGPDYLAKVRAKLGS